jgi:hypothetical protein
MSLYFYSVWIRTAVSSDYDLKDQKDLEKFCQFFFSDINSLCHFSVFFALSNGLSLWFFTSLFFFHSTLI